MAHDFPLIIEDGTCVPGANAWHDIQAVRDYFSRLPNGSHWDNSAQGCQISDLDAKRFMFAGVEYLKLFNWRNNCCCKNDLPMPIDCGCCDGCASGSVKALKTASILLTDAFAQGWSPYVEGGPEILVKSMSTPGGGSYNFASPVDLQSFRGARKSAVRTMETVPTYTGIMDRLCRILKCFLINEPVGGIKLVM